ncbi:MAG: hypothetical protein ABIQ73_25325 [Acidimicrobiales bacterium]
MTTTLTHRHDALADQLAAAFIEFGAQDYLSQARWVDILLDLFCATEDDVLRRVISDSLNEIRHVNLVRCFDMRACLLLVTALSSPSPVPDALDPADA